MPLASIVIRCFNEEKHIGKLLAGIQEQTISDVETVIVDSGSTDATLAIARRYPVRIVSISPADFSFGRSLNRGCATAHGEYIVLASAHVYPIYRDWLERLLEPLGNERVGLVYGKQRGVESSKYSERQVFKRWFPDESTLDQDHSFCNNANAAIRRSLWEQFPYNEALTGLEDLAWAKQIKAAGYCIAYAAPAEVAHVHEESWGNIRNRYRREALAMKEIYAAERFDFIEFLRLLGTNVLNDYYHAWKEGVLLQNAFEIFVFRYNQFLGTYQGFNQHGAVGKELRRRFYYPNGFERHNSPEQRRDGHGLAIDYSHLPAGREQ